MRELKVVKINAALKSLRFTLTLGLVGLIILVITTGLALGGYWRDGLNGSVFYLVLGSLLIIHSMSLSVFVIRKGRKSNKDGEKVPGDDSNKS